MFHRNRHSQREVYDELGAILFDILRCTCVENFAFLFLRCLSSEQKSIVVVVRHLFSANNIFDSREFDAHYLQRAGFNAAGDFEHRKLLIISERNIEFVHDYVEELPGHVSRIVVVNG